MALIDGIKVIIGGDEYVMPPLTLGQLRNGALSKINEHDKLIADGNVFEAVSKRAEVIGMALRRNYPELSDEKLLDLLDLRNSPSLWSIALGGSGIILSPETAEVPLPTASGPSTGS